jgi:hypothetical protein
VGRGSNVVSQQASLIHGAETLTPASEKVRNLPCLGAIIPLKIGKRQNVQKTHLKHAKVS